MKIAFYVGKFNYIKPKRGFWFNKKDDFIKKKCQPIGQHLFYSDLRMFTSSVLYGMFNPSLLKAL